MQTVSFQRVEASIAPEPVYKATEPIQATTTVEEPNYSSCVVYARRFLPVLPMMRTPADLEPNAEPRPGAAILMQYGDVHHIGIVTHIHDDKVCLREANYKRNQETFRCLDLTDSEIRGYWFPG